MKSRGRVGRLGCEGMGCSPYLVNTTFHSQVVWRKFIEQKPLFKLESKGCVFCKSFPVNGLRDCNDAVDQVVSLSKLTCLDSVASNGVCGFLYWIRSLVKKV